jgi:dolichol-phosphate mannosyltransferase
MTAFVIVPTYNEAENLRPLVTSVLAQDGVSGVVVVDDGSPDGTGALADGLAAELPTQVSVVHRPGKLGLGTAYKAGFGRALALGADRVVTMDADFSHPPEAIPRLLALAATCDLVIGSRYVPGGQVRNWGIDRRLLSWSANALARAALGLTARDCTAGFRCYDVALLRRIDLDRVRSSDYAFLIEMLFLCQRSGASVGEVPITFEDRRYGASKISRREIWRALGTVARLSVSRVVGG